MPALRVQIPQVNKKTQKTHHAAVEAAIRDLRYGQVCVNVWSALGYGMETAGWGGYPPDNEFPSGVVSGVGMVRNCCLYDDVQKSVVRTPFRCKAHLKANPKDIGVSERVLRFMPRVARFLARN